MKRIHFLIIFTILGGLYIHGARVVTLEEIPSSKRPWQPYLTADYAAQHLSQPTD